MIKPVQASTYTFRSIIEGGFLYIDKTRYLYDLVHPGTGIYFIARPRRFGKSLMISTLAEIFQGNPNSSRDCGSTAATMIGNPTLFCALTLAVMVLTVRRSWNR